MNEAVTRVAHIRRTTKETDILLALNLDGQGDINIHTGIGFLDHMLTALATHAGWDLELYMRGDLEIDCHHSVEDCAITLGQALAHAIKFGAPITRFASAYAPLDEALVRAVLDISGRPTSIINLELDNARLGDLDGQMVTHFFKSLADNAALSLHIDVIRGTNDHHKAEAAFKALALALRAALAPRPTVNKKSEISELGASSKGKTTQNFLLTAEFSAQKREFLK